jgi:spore maturation protein CgeB
VRLLFLGLSITSSWGNGHATTYRALCRALADRGHRITFVERDAPWYAGAHRDLPPDACRFADVRLYPDWAHGWQLVRGLLRQTDAVLLGSYFPDGADAAARLADHFPGPRLFYDIDTPLTVQAFRERGSAGYLDAAQVPLFDTYFSFTGGPVLRELEQRFAARRALPLYCSVGPADHEPAARPPAGRSALGYMGTYAPDRQPALDALLLEPARRRADLDFLVAGPQYPATLAWPRNVHRREHVPPAEHAAFHAASRLTLNLTRAEMRRWGWSPSVRIFEAAACAAAIVSDRWPGLDELLEPGTEILIADHTGDVLDFLDLDDDALRDIGRAARKRVLAEHSAAVRAARFEATVQALLDGHAPASASLDTSPR